MGRPTESSCLAVNLRVRIANSRQVAHPRLGPELVQHRVGAWLLTTPYHLRFGIGERAKDDRIGRARLLARRANVVAPRLAALAPGSDLSFANSLHAERTLLHDATLAHRD